MKSSLMHYRGIHSFMHKFSAKSDSLYVDCINSPDLVGQEIVSLEPLGEC